MTRLSVRLLCLGSIAAALATCGREEPPVGPAGPTQVFATLVSPNTDDAGIVFWLTGPPGVTIDTLVTLCNCELHLRRVSERDVRGLIIGNLLSSQPTLRFTVTGAAEPSHFTFTIRQISGRSGELRYAHQGYSFTVQ